MMHLHGEVTVLEKHDITAWARCLRHCSGGYVIYESWERDFNKNWVNCIRLGENNDNNRFWRKTSRLDELIKIFFSTHFENSNYMASFSPLSFFPSHKRVIHSKRIKSTQRLGIKQASDLLPGIPCCLNYSKTSLTSLIKYTVAPMWRVIMF